MRATWTRDLDVSPTSGPLQSSSGPLGGQVPLAPRLPFGRPGNPTRAEFSDSDHRWPWARDPGPGRIKSVLAPCSILALPVSIERTRIDLPFSHLSHVAVKHAERPVVPHCEQRSREKNLCSAEAQSLLEAQSLPGQYGRMRLGSSASMSSSIGPLAARGERGRGLDW
jgi:hypothetical protein